MMMIGPPAERNQDATCYIANLDQQVDEELLWELFIQVGPVINVYIPKDRITSTHSGYGFVEMRSETDADYAMNVLNGIKLYGKQVKVNKASQDKKVLDVGANLFIGNLGAEVDNALLYNTFIRFGTFVTPPHVEINPETGESKGHAFVSYDRFESSDAAISQMNGQFLGGNQISVRYARKGKSNEHFGSKAERLLAANNPSLQQRDIMHAMYGVQAQPTYGGYAPPMQQQNMYMPVTTPPTITGGYQVPPHMMTMSPASNRPIPPPPPPRP
jgi:splicing factor 3B subunit 4